jgi:multiple sugar transport system permease protein
LSELQNYRNFLKVKYHGDIAKLNQSYKENYASFDVIPYPELNGAGAKLVDYGNFISGWHDSDTNKLYQAALDDIYIEGLEFKFRDYLKKKYGSIAKVNTILHSSFPDFDVIEPPQIEWQHQKIMKNKNAYRWKFSTRNFKTVFSYIMLQGRGLYNTVIYCALAILCALTVNPIAAYALSRFGLPSTYKVLLFLMLTMAFPQMVTQIPNFLMMREIGILNTFWALILPSMASGYSIFLLKGFFDSLPKELYESAMLDGAGEFRMFFQFTMSLSKPILAVIALNAFTHAYSNFMMALLICQDPKMWTLMPWLYQLQMNSCQSVVYTSLIIASIPTFLIFMLCQNVIMRGIVVPVEK